ncbi:MAG: hypothetical protein RMM17_02300 [Acidobacteriota bacterium]|nr:hypothetical protein [Blastocatellia bacterium]MDW8411501.1 hypothetical protein [Acidobacteriota bacterium]
MYTVLLVIIFAVSDGWNSDGKFVSAYVADAGLSALRVAPTPQSVCKRRLGIGRKVYVAQCFDTAYGRYCKVLLTRRTRGYMLARALVFRRRGEDERLLKMALRATGKDKLALLWLSKRLFSRSPLAGRINALFEEEAERLAEELNKKVRKNIKPLGDNEDVYILNSRLLDRYSRMGIFFRLDAAGQLRYAAKLERIESQRKRDGEVDFGISEATSEACLE